MPVRFNNNTTTQSDVCRNVKNMTLRHTLSYRFCGHSIGFVYKFPAVPDIEMPVLRIQYRVPLQVVNRTIIGITVNNNITHRSIGKLIRLNENRKIVPSPRVPVFIGRTLRDINPSAFRCSEMEISPTMSERRV